MIVLGAELAQLLDLSFEVGNLLFEFQEDVHHQAG
jgi:hypothetical protein